METSPSTADDAVGQSFDFDSNVCRISDSVMREEDDPISFFNCLNLFLKKTQKTKKRRKSAGCLSSEEKEEETGQ